MVMQRSRLGSQQEGQRSTTRTDVTGYFVSVMQLSPDPQVVAPDPEVVAPEECANLHV